MTEIAKDLAQQIFQYCSTKSIIIRTVESCTGGNLAAQFTNIPGSSKFFDRGLITYSNIAKHELLNIPQDALSRYGAVSFETVTLMARNLTSGRHNILSIATTGVLGPDSDDKNNPIGLVYIAINYNNKTEAKRLNLTGNRDSIREQTILETLKLCLNTIQH
ncbi:MAG: CinA family protein [Rickettsiales bacterium]|nr:CinA family protein [Rickettsiales bacterium]